MDEPATLPEVHAKNPFDIGDTSIDMAPFAREVPDEKPEEKPRNADGTFAKAETPPEVKEEPAPVERDGLRDSLIQDARELGFEDHELEGMSNAVLFRTVKIATRQQLDSLREQARARTVLNAEVRNPEPMEDPIDFGIDPDTGRPFSPADLHPSLIAIAKQNHELKKQMAQQEQQRRQRDFWDVAETIDDIFEQLGPKYERILGKGAGVDLAQNKDPGLKRRLAVLSEAGINVEGVSANQVRRAAARIKAAADLLYGPAVEAQEKPAAPNPYTPAPPGAPPSAARQQVVSQEDWEEAATAAPTSRPPAELPPGDERAVRNLEQKMADLSRSKRNGRQSDAEIKRGLFPGGSVAG